MSFLTNNLNRFATALAVLVMATGLMFADGATAQTNPQSDSTGLSGTVPADPPSVGATISVPTNGTVVSELPIEASGVCQSGLTVTLFINDIFSGSDSCLNGIFSITSDLFPGINELVVIVFDALDQEGPPSNTVTVTFEDDSGISLLERVVITSALTSRGADPGESLTWRFGISGGQAPYAIKVDWGDGQESLITSQRAGEFSASHTYDQSGIYRVLVKATDDEGRSGYLQVISIANGPLSGGSTDETGIPAGRIIERSSATPLLFLTFLIVAAFVMGLRYQKYRLKQMIRPGLAFDQKKE